MAERNDWYYWTHNQHCHFIQFRDCDDKVATATIFPLGERFVWKINGPCCSSYGESVKGLSFQYSRTKPPFGLISIRVTFLLGKSKTPWSFDQGALRLLFAVTDLLRNKT